MKPTAPRPPAALLALWLVPLVCHGAFSWIGFNPTDDGWLQAIARRLLDGQIPHRDFISVRPVLSAALQIPLAAWGGDHVFWLARLWGWFEIGALAWLWSGFLAPALPAVRATLFGLVLVLTAHTFPVMAWHTLDGLLICSAAVALARRGTVAAWVGAFFLGGLATLARQNFVFFLPFLALGLPHPRLWPVTLAAGCAPALYGLFLAFAGALPDFLQQLTATRGALFVVAVVHPLQTPAVWVGLALGLGSAVALLRSRTLSPRTGARLDATFYFATATATAVCLWHGPTLFPSAAYGLLAFVLALALGALCARRLNPTTRLLTASALGLAWSALISSGYNHPALASGVLFVVLWHLAALLGGREFSAPRPVRLAGFTAVALLAVSLWHARRAFPYGDKPARELTYEAGTALRGATGLSTNRVTHEALLELQALTTSLAAQGRPYAIFTDYSAHWVNDSRRNPLDCEWPQSTELALSPELYGRFAERLFRLPPDTVLIAQRHVTSLHAIDLVPVDAASQFYLLQCRLIPHARLLSGGQYFELYTLPRLP